MMTLQISPHIRYRREHFGCLTLCTKNKRIRRYNRTAAYIIEQYFNPRHDEPLINSLDTDIVRSFLMRLVDDGILMFPSSNNSEEKRIFGTSIKTFSPSHYSVPIGIEIELTRKCLRRCSYCAYNSEPKYNTYGELSNTEWINVLKDAADSGVFISRFTGGDPLLNPGFETILRSADDLGFLITVGTDLTSFTKRHAEFLRSLTNFSLLQTTLDGPSPKYADEERGNGNYRAVITAIDLLNEREIPFMVGMVITSNNFDQVGETSALAYKLGARRFVISPLYKSGRGVNIEEKIPNETQMKVAWSQLEDSYKKYDNDISGVYSNIELDLGQFIRPADQFLRIDPVGNVYSSIKLTDQIGQLAVAGSVKNSSISEIWNKSGVLSRMRRVSSIETSMGKLIEADVAIETLKEMANGAEAF